jgi:hypothetical protein
MLPFHKKEICTLETDAVRLAIPILTGFCPVKCQLTGWHQNPAVVSLYDDLA